MAKRGWLSVLAYLVLALLVETATAADDRTTCLSKTETPDRIRACDRTIGSSKLKGLDLSIAYNNRGNAHINKRDYDRALADLNEAVRIDPRNGVAFSNRGYAHYNKRAYDAAIADFTRSIEINPKYVNSWSLRGLTRGAMRDYATAIADYNEALKIEPDHALTLIRRGNAYRLNGDLDRSIADLSRAIKIDPKAAAAFEGRARAYAAKSEQDRAITDFTEMARLEARNVEAYLGRAQAHTSKRDLDRAIEDYTQVLTISPRHVTALVRRGNVYRGKNDFDRALADFEEAIKINPRAVGAYEGRGLVWLDRSDFDRAITEFGEAIRVDPKFVPAYVSRSTAYMIKGDVDRGIADATQAIEIDPKNASGYNNRGSGLREKGDLDRAMADLDEAIRLNPRYANAYSNRGRVWRAKGNIDQALTDFSEAIRHNPQMLRARTQRGLAYESKGDLVLARADFRISAQGVANGLLERKAKETAQARLSVIGDGGGGQVAAVSQPPQRGTAPGATQDRRIALVIGNGKYANATPLPNPVNDAKAVSQGLRDIGFEVTEGLDLEHTAMSRMIRDFLRTAPTARLALVFYAGHGLQVDGQNYLVPVDANLKSPSDLKFETVDLDAILSGLNDESRANIVILDACRDNPLARTFSTRTRSGAVGQGLAAYSSLGTGTLIAFATAPGQTALDGDGSNSPFTAAFVRHLKTPGLEIRQMLTRVRADVVSLTKAKQVPWDNSSLLGEVVLSR